MTGVEMWFLVGFALQSTSGGGWLSVKASPEIASHVVLGTEPGFRTLEECQAAAKAGRVPNLTASITDFVAICVQGWQIHR